MNISDIRAGLRTLVESEKTTYAQIARESGVAAGTLSAFVNNKYNGDNERVAQTLERWLENYHRAAELPEPPRFVETRTARQIWTSMRFASLTESISVICGNLSRRFYEWLAAQYGFTVRLTDSTEGQWVTQVNIYGIKNYRNATVLDNVLTPLRVYESGALECLLEKYKPAHQIYKFVYHDGDN